MHYNCNVTTSRCPVVFACAIHAKCMTRLACIPACSASCALQRAPRRTCRVHRGLNERASLHTPARRLLAPPARACQLWPERCSAAALTTANAVVGCAVWEAGARGGLLQDRGLRTCRGHSMEQGMLTQRCLSRKARRLRSIRIVANHTIWRWWHRRTLHAA